MPKHSTNKSKNWVPLKTLSKNKNDKNKSKNKPVKPVVKPAKKPNKLAKLLNKKKANKKPKSKTIKSDEKVMLEYVPQKKKPKARTVKANDIEMQTLGREKPTQLKKPIKPKKNKVKKAPVKKSAVKKAPVKKGAVKKAPVKKASTKKASTKKTPVKKAPVKKGVIKKTSVKKTTTKNNKKPTYGFAVLNANYLVKLKAIGQCNFDRPGIINPQYARYQCHLAEVVKVWNAITGKLIKNKKILKQLKTDPVGGAFYKTKIAARSNYFVNRYRGSYNGQMLVGLGNDGFFYYREYYKKGRLTKSKHYNSLNKCIQTETYHKNGNYSKITYMYTTNGKKCLSRKYTYDQYGSKKTLHRKSFNKKGKVIGEYQSKFVRKMSRGLHHKSRYNNSYYMNYF